MLAHTFYNLGIYAYSSAIGVAAIFNKKAQFWVNGRKGWKLNLRTWRAQNSGKLFWFHCASLGEFEQGRPVIEAIRQRQPDIKILLTFFSPSGFEIRKNYEGADGVFYLPADSPANARAFLEIIQPAAAFFVKYEYWANYFFCCKKHQIPLFIVSAILRPDQRFFGVMQSFWKKVLHCVHHFFVQNERTISLLNQNGFDQATLCGDTRFDRVISIASQSKSLPEIAAFAQDSFVLVAGSTWPRDEDILAASIEKSGMKLIIVPHEIDPTHIQSIETKFTGSIRWSQLRGKSLREANVLIVDSIGMLSSIYQYADVVMIGGGFGKGIHNTLEAAVWGKPLLFGPVHQKFDEAIGLIREKAALVIHQSNELDENLRVLKSKPDVLLTMSQNARAFVEGHSGATQRILHYLESQKLI